MTPDAQEEEMPRFLTVKEVSELLRLTVAATRHLLIEGDIVAFQVGPRGLWRVETSDLEAYVLSQKALAAPRSGGATPEGDSDHQRTTSATESLAL